MGTELELKLAIAPADGALVALHPRVLAHATAPWLSRQMVARYFDTTDRLLAQAGMALRLRREGARWVQTFKTSHGPALALRSRGEWEVALSGPAFDWDALADTPLRDLPAWPSLPGQLREQFVTRFTRRSVPLRLGSDTVVELAIDLGDIRCGRGAAVRHEAISEVELELMAGDPRELWRLAAALSEVVALMPLHGSKAERGHALVLGRAAEPRKARPAPFAADVPLPAALAGALAPALDALLHNLPHVAPDRPEFVHQARVALRRLRSVLRAVAPQLPAGRTARWARRVGPGMQSLGRQLGAARDLDVLLEQTLPALGKRADPLPPEALAAVRGRATPAQTAAYAALCGAQCQPDVGALLLALERLCFELAQPSHVDASVPQAGEVLQRLLARQHAKVQRAARELTRLNAPERHHLRIEVKRLRYLFDLFSDAGSAKPAVRYADALAGLQEALGGINDAAVSVALLRRLEAPAALLAAVQRHEAREIRRQLPDVAQALARLDLCDVPWHRFGDAAGAPV